LQLPNILGFTFGVVQMGLYVFYMNATPVAGEGKEGKGKLAAAEELPVVVNVGKLAAATPDRSTGAVHVHPVPPPRAVEVAAV
jgi:solute carrier family 50 protein (sugar transporter)